MGDFLNGYPWAHWCTLTFRPPASERDVGRVPREWGRWRKKIRGAVPVGLDYALRQWSAFQRATTIAAGVPLFWFYGVEHGERLGRLHLHALFGNTERLPVATMRASWTAGFADVDAYDPTRGASYYVTKYVTKELAEWDVSGGVREARQLYHARARNLFRSSTHERDPLTAAALAQTMRAHERGRGRRRVPVS